jgi:hypothetical protein
MTVVALSVFMAISKVKDDNIVQAMQAAKSSSLDSWSEYQATKTKLAIAETADQQVAMLGTLGDAGVQAKAAASEAQFAAQIAKYRREIPALRGRAEDFQNQYDALNVHDDQFDASDAALSIAVSVSAVSALVESAALLQLAWLFAAAGVVMGVAGFLGWSLHLGWLSNLLG